MRFAKQLEGELPAGSRIGVAKAAGLAYFLPSHHVTNVNGVVSPAFAHPHPNVVGVEILRRRPELRFDYWLLKTSDARSGWSTWATQPGALLEPVLVTGRLGERRVSEVGRVIAGGEARRAPRFDSAPGLRVVLRTASRAEAVVRTTGRTRRQVFHADAPLELVVRIGGEVAARPELPLLRDPALVQEFRIDLDLPEEASSSEVELEIEGRYISLGYRFFPAP